ncbi:MAG: glycine--tRNA ligase subunit beta [Endomicrobium sp.]|nr:glycine--tRNA ligase subunit beta [Endomicrobium sp.]
MIKILRSASRAKETGTEKQDKDTKMIDENMKNALLEIGAEELPCSYIEPALKQIENLAMKAFNSFGLKYEAIKTYATPRRLVLIVENLAGKSEDTMEEILGPSLKVAKDVHRNYTQAAVGFAAKNGEPPEKLVVKTTERGEYLSFIKKTKGEKTEKLLAIIFPDIIKNISFPKTMVWEPSGFKFARPVRSIVALYGKKIIKFKIADVDSSNWTIGLHTYDGSKIKIDSPENYLVTMKNKSVIVNQQERRKEMKKSIDSIVASVGSVINDDDLVDEVNYLVEYPSAVLCTFDKKYLDLPVEVLTVCMKKSQKCFAVNGKDGSFSNYFIGIKNGVSAYQEIAKEGYEKVVTARLADAEFFYRNDLKNGLGANVEKLKGVIFHKEIGTVYEKVERIKQIANLFNKEFDMQIDDAILEKAIMFSKADLVSEMVFEYPELQGIVGKIYALKLGEKSDVALSSEQHYWPLSASGQLPSNSVATLISMSDKIDTLVANFSIGLEPSGSADPYGLRRAGIGFIRMVMENFPNQNLGNVIEKVFEFLPEKVKNNPKAKNACDKLINFFWQRIDNILELKGYNSFEVKAVTEGNKLNALGSLHLKLVSLQNAKQKGDFGYIVTVFKRIGNIISQAKKQNINISETLNETLFIEGAEKALYVSSKEARTAIENYMQKNEYDKVFDKVLELKPTIDNFFEKVMVMSENETVKINRVALLNYINNIFASFIDFSALQ